jgi:hypothetical protein
MTITLKKLTTDSGLIKAYADLTKATGNLTESTLVNYSIAGARVIINKVDGKSPKGERAVDQQIRSGGVWSDKTKKYEGGLDKGQISKAVTVLEFHLKDIIAEGSAPSAEELDQALQVALSQVDAEGNLLSLYAQYLIAKGKDGEKKSTPETLDTIARRLVKRAIAQGKDLAFIIALVSAEYEAQG